MKIYTSYFGNINKIMNAGIVPIGIALYQPRWFKGVNFKIVAPLRYMLMDDLSREEYIREYTDKVLRMLDAKMLVSQLEQSSMGKDVALLCYEKPNEFCHRHILADWLSKQLNVKICEFGENKEIKQEVIIPTLF